MKILYALPATGNGHISRAAAIYPYLKKYGAVDFLISGSNSQLNYSFPVKYKFKGLSLYYDCSGGLSLRNIFQKNSFRNFWKDAKSLDLSHYDMVISDYEPISALACKIKKQPFLHWGHQASFVYEEVPRPTGKIYPGKWILENLVYSPLSYGIHFKSFHSNISTSIIKDEIFYAPRLEENLVTVYLQQYNLDTLLNFFKNYTKSTINIFHPEIKEISTFRNIHLFPIHKILFDQSLIYSKLLITASGFESPSEAMHLNKRLISIPIHTHYEQSCNAIALDAMGVVVLRSLSQLSNDIIDRELKNFGLADYNFHATSSEEACLNIMNYWESNFNIGGSGVQSFEPCFDQLFV